MYIEYISIGETIRALRKANGMTKEELSELVIKSREDTIKKMCGKSRKYFIE